MSAYNLGVKVGQIWVAADGSQYGHLVTDVDTFAYCDDVVTTPFSVNNVGESGNRIDVFKLSCVRYYQPDDIPDWVPAKIMAEKKAITKEKGDG